MTGSRYATCRGEAEFQKNVFHLHLFFTSSSSSAIQFFSAVRDEKGTKKSAQSKTLILFYPSENYKGFNKLYNFINRLPKRSLRMVEGRTSEIHHRKPISHCLRTNQPTKKNPDDQRPETKYTLAQSSPHCHKQALRTSPSLHNHTYMTSLWFGFPKSPKLKCEREERSKRNMWLWLIMVN